MAETTGIINGSNLKITLGAEGGTLVMVDNLTDCSISTNLDMRDTTTKSNAGYKALLPGMIEATMSFLGCLLTMLQTACMSSLTFKILKQS